MNIASDSLIIAVIALGAAVIAIIGGVVALFKQRVIVDKDSKEVIEIELPGIGKFKTNYPSLGAMGIGMLLVLAVLMWFDVKIEKIPFTATVTVNSPNSLERKTADVFLGVIPQRYRRSQSGVNTGEPVDIELTVDKGEEYDVIVYTPVSIHSNGTVQRVMQFGPMKTEYANGHEIGTYKAELIVE